MANKKDLACALKKSIDHLEGSLKAAQKHKVPVTAVLLPHEAEGVLKARKLILDEIDEISSIT